MITAASLRALGPLKGYDLAELETLVSASTVRTLAPGAVLWREGEPGRACFVLASGEVDVLRGSGSAERVLGTLGPGAFVGQIALVDRGPRTATVRARSACEVLEFSREVFERLLLACSPLALRFQTQIAVAGIRQLRAATERLSEALSAREARRSSRPAPSGRPQASPPTEALSYIQTAATEWGMSLEDLDAIEVVAFAGAEAPGASRSRGRRT